jgi:hypothetical protein
MTYASQEVSCIIYNPKFYYYIHDFVIYQISDEFTTYTLPRLTLSPLTWRIWWAPNNASRWQMGFNLAFKGLIKNYSPTGRRNHGRPSKRLLDSETGTGQQVAQLHDRYTIMMTYTLFTKNQFSVASMSLSTRHGASSGCGWRNGLQYGG